jgi:hypothetical protein
MRKKQAQNATAAHLCTYFPFFLLLLAIHIGTYLRSIQRTHTESEKERDHSEKKR